MNQKANTNKTVNSYLYHFQEAQMNLINLIKEERLEKRIRKSRQRVLK